MDWADKIATNIFNRVHTNELEEKIAQALRDAHGDGTIAGLRNAANAPLIENVAKLKALLDHKEESDSGHEFSPVSFSCCRVQLQARAQKVLDDLFKVIPENYPKISVYELPSPTTLPDPS